ncbi:MAG: hypothetical protein VX589_20255 [Myxococcota bacterium]|nr:hypothetical protein [Myxococcota bacterium]
MSIHTPLHLKLNHALQTKAGGGRRSSDGGAQVVPVRPRRAHLIRGVSRIGLMVISRHRNRVGIVGWGASLGGRSIAKAVGRSVARRASIVPAKTPHFKSMPRRCLMFRFGDDAVS